MPIAIVLASLDGSPDLCARLEHLGQPVSGAAAAPDALRALCAQIRPDLILVDGAGDLAEAAERLGAAQRAAVVRLLPAGAQPAPERLWQLSAPYSDRELLLAIRGAAALSQAEREHAASALMRVLAAIVGSVAHEYNNILTSISGNAELALFDIAPDAEARLSVDQIHASVRRAITLTRQILVLTRRATASAEAIDISLLMGEIAPLLAIVAGKRASFTAEISGEPIYVACDPNQLRYALIGLVIAAALGAGDGEIHVAAAALADRQVAEVVVRHTIGARASGGAHSFIAYTDGYQEVAEVGLAIARALVADARGGLRVSDEGGVARATVVTLPLVTSGDDQRF